MEELKRCPFCGKDIAEFTTVCTLEECANFEEEDCPECYDPVGSDGCIHLVICPVDKGGLWFGNGMACKQRTCGRGVEQEGRRCVNM